MKILICSDVYPGLAGIARFVKEFSFILNKKHSITILTLKKENPLERVEEVIIRKEEVKEQENETSLLYYIIPALLVVIIIIALMHFLGKGKVKKQDNGRLSRYISDNLRKGYKPEQIKNVLLGYGYNGEDIDRLFRKIPSE